jgi:hypothetical protein
MSDHREARLRTIVSSHSVRYPLMECADVYKLLFQSALGSSHSTDISRRYAMARFEEEAINPGIGPPEPIVDTISPDGNITRINIRPYLSAGLPHGKLVEAFVRTGKEFRGSADTLELYCSWVVEMKAEGLLTEGLQNIDEYLSGMSKAGFPIIHHSREYNNAYSPSYRVIATAFIPDLGII